MVFDFAGGGDGGSPIRFQARHLAGALRATDVFVFEQYRDAERLGYGPKSRDMREQEFRQTRRTVGFL
jgi:hypothetical protein